VRGREASSPVGGARSRVVGCRTSGHGRRCRPMLRWHVGVVGPCCAVSGDCGGRVGIRRVGSGCLGVCRWSVSVRIGARLTRIVVRHGVQLVTCVARSILPHAHPFDCHGPNDRVLYYSHTAPKKGAKIPDERTKSAKICSIERGTWPRGRHIPEMP